ADALWQVLVKKLLQLRLVVPQVELRRRIRHEEPDHPFGLGSVMQNLHLAKAFQSFVGRTCVADLAAKQIRIEERTQRCRTESFGHPTKEIAAGFGEHVVLYGIHLRSFLSSREPESDW